MIRAASNAMNQHKELKVPAADQSGPIFEKHTVKFAAAAKSQANNQKLLLSQLSAPSIEPNLRSFPKKKEKKNERQQADNDCP